MWVKTMAHQRFLTIFLAFCALSIASPASQQTLGLESDALIPQKALPPYRLLSLPTQADFEGNGQMETVQLSNGKAVIRSGQEVVWTSPGTWQVVQAAITDLDHDGRPEAALLVWRPFMPWPVDRWLPYGGRISGFHDAHGFSCHLILIGRTPKGYQEVWAGSALAEPIYQFTAADLNGNGNQELITLEGQYSDAWRQPEKHAGAPAAGNLKVWEWNGFGFSVVYHLAGRFTDLAVIQAATGHPFILIP